MNKKIFLPLLLVFIFTTSFFITGKTFLEKQGASQQVLIVGNLILFAATLLSFFLMYKGIYSKTTNAFVRNVYGGFIAKLMICLFGSLIYFMSTDKVNKPALFILMFLYFVYTAVEVSSLMKLNKLKKNAEAGSAR
jgi:uncharacterized membrane protein YcfT